MALRSASCRQETYGAQPPIEILRQMIDARAYPESGGWYDQKEPYMAMACICRHVFLVWQLRERMRSSGFEVLC